MNSFNFEAIGTKWSIDVIDSITSQEKETLLRKIEERIEIFDKTYSRFRSDSLVTKMSQKRGDYMLPEDSKQLFSLYKNLYTLTDGEVTPLIGNVLEDAGYDAGYSLKSGTLHHPDAWEKVLDYKYPHLTVKKPVLLDFGAAGKGYLIDILGELLFKNGISNFCVDGSGDLLYKSEKKEPIRIGLEHPEDPKQVIGVATITDGSLCGSAGNRRTWGDYHHIISPHSLKSPKNILAVWVTAESAILADGLATCLFFTPAVKLQSYYTFEYAIVKDDYSLEVSSRFPGEFFYS
jgi:thiamine biosynthesis lipoprotein